MKRLLPVLSLPIFTFVLLLSSPKKITATDLLVSDCFSPTQNEFLGRAITFHFAVENANVVTALAAEWNVVIEVRNSQNQLVFNTTVPGKDISPFTTTELTANQTWTPTVAGTYTVKKDVNYQFEINPGNDVFEGNFDVHDKPGMINGETPADGSTGVPIQNTRLQWILPPQDIITGTRVFFGTTLQDADPELGTVLTTTGGPLTAVDLPTLPGNTQHFWGVEIQNPAGETFNGPFSFATQPLPCTDTPPVITDPPDGFRGLSPDGFIIAWDNPPTDPTIVGSDIFLSPTSSGVDPSLTAPLTATLTVETSSFPIPGDQLEPETEYRLIVGTKCENGGYTFSDILTVTTSKEPCFPNDDFFPVSPPDGATMVNLNPAQLEWNAGSGQFDRIDVYIGTSPNDVNPGVANVFTTTTDLGTNSVPLPPTFLQPNTEYFWQVGYIGPNCEVFSGILDFTTGDVLCPNPPVFDFPQPGQQNVPFDPVPIELVALQLQGVDPILPGQINVDIVVTPPPSVGQPFVLPLNPELSLSGSVHFIEENPLLPNTTYGLLPRVHCNNETFPGESISIKTQPAATITGSVRKAYVEGGDQFVIDSFFDVFTDITIDGGPPGILPPIIRRTSQPDNNGLIQVQNVPSGTFETRIDGLEGWTYNTPPTGIHNGEITTPGENPVPFEFILIPPPSEVTGKKWQDDGDGEEEPGEIPLPDWPINLDGTSFAGNSVNLSTVTDVNGEYTFSNVPPGNYTVSEDQVSGWQTAFPASGSHIITIDEGIPHSGLNFGNVPPVGSIHGRKFYDITRDGEFGDDEFGLNGFVIELLNAQGQVIARDTTHFMNSDGEGLPDMAQDFGWFWFNNLPPGLYRLREIIPPGWEITSPQGNLHEVDLAPGQVVNNLLFGNINQDLLDFGDLPEPADTIFGPCPPGFQCYPTLLPQGARHVARGPLFGTLRDTEGNGIPRVFADGDDSTGVDDEDGVAFLSFVPSVSGEVEITVDGAPGDFPAFISGWIDFNGDGYLGVFLNPEEYIISAVVNAPGTYNFVFNIPPLVQGSGYARFRIASDPFSAAFPEGLAINGEVEDYVGLGFDYGDANNDIDPQNPQFPAGYPVRLIDDGARHIATPTIRLGGTQTDVDNDGQPSRHSTGDDYNNRDDEDGIEWVDGFTEVYNGPDPLAPNQTLRVIGFTQGESVTFKPLATWNGFINVWLDLDRTSGWNNTDEWLFVDEPIKSGPDFTELTFDVPVTASVGFTYMRFRYTANPNVQQTGPESTGEVEDYLVVLLPPLDYGDAPDPYPTLLVDNGAKHVISDFYLGELIDAEPDGQPSPDATDDDQIDLADEDGIRPVSASVRGNSVQVEVISNTPSGATGFLSGWIDFNQDDTWDPVTEKVFDDVPLTGGTDTLSAAIPANAAVGETFGRFRFTDVTGVGPLDPDPLTNFTLVLGEVEDYQIMIDSILVSVDDFGYVPTEFNLHQNFPNPFNPSTIIRYDVAQASHVKLDVYNIIGQHIITLVNEEKAAGAYKVEFNVKDLPTGIYVYSVRIGEFVNTKKMILMK